MTTDVPFTVFCKVPEQPIRNHGVHATTYEGFKQPAVRLTERDQERVKRAADLIGVKFTTFLRESAINMADAIIRHAEEHEKEKRNVHANGPPG